VRLLLSPTLFALVMAMVTAALAAKGARAGRTELCCGRGSTAWAAAPLQPSALTAPQPDVGRALATLAKRCAADLGSDRRPRRHVSTNTTPRFSRRRGPRRHLTISCGFMRGGRWWAGATVVAVKASLGRWPGRGAAPASRAVYRGWCGLRAEDGCSSCARHCWLAQPIATLGGRNRCPGNRGNNMCSLSQTPPQPPVVAGRVRGRGQADPPLVSTRTRGEMPRRPDLLAGGVQGEEGSRTWGKCRADTRGWRAQRFSRTTLGIGCEARVLRPVRLPPAPESCRPDRPPSLHTMRKTQRADPQAKRVTAAGKARCGVWAHTVLRPPIGAELRGASFGEHRLLAALLQPALCQAEHWGAQLPKQSSHARSRALCARRARPWPPEQPSPSP